ncbi:hypothetical protein HGRIS_011639 [Hohenbuehelia grisea]|uniref:Fungal-type protein kinase domain-containing protein n=1 Tax=Hohenbuehelia grisea TaxID=104357 RepID=A0ABR3JVX3_9AGAR
MPSSNESSESLQFPQDPPEELDWRFTPLNLNSNVHSTHTTSLATGDKKAHKRKQRVLQGIIKHELRHTTFEGEWVRNALCPADADIVGAVIDSLQRGKTPIFAKTLQTKEFVLLDWPEEAGERTYYRPFVKMLNAIVDTFASIFPEQHKKSVLRNTKFYIYDRTMLGSVDGEAALKPDFLCSNATVATGVRIGWLQAGLVGEIKLDWSDLIAQAGTYVRCQFAASGHRIFVPVLCLNQAESCFRLCFFHRGGLLATTPMPLTTESGFREFVSTIIGLWQWDTLEKAGFDECSSHSHFNFNNTQYRIDTVLCRRQAIRGRATSVYVVRIDDSISKPAVAAVRTRAQARGHAYLAQNAPTLVQPLKKDKTIAAWSRLNPFDDLKPTPVITPKHLGPIDLPDMFVVKCSYQPEGRDKEEDIFSSVQGFIGIPNVLAGYDATQFRIPSTHTPVFWDVIRFTSEDSDEESDGVSDEDEDSDEDDSDEDSDDGARKSDVVAANARKQAQENGNVPRNFEVRHHRHLVIKTMGRRLDPSLGPRKLVRAIQHAVIGHCALFTEGGYLHRDVSNGNIVVLLEPTQGNIPAVLSSVVQSRECTAVIIDGDVAKRWGSLERSSHRSGTLPFLSKNVAEKWRESRPLYHSPIDDLESFIWVILYELIHWAPKRTKWEKLLWKELNFDDVEIVALAKSSVVTRWTDPNSYQKITLSRSVRPFRDLLHGLFVCVGNYQANIEAFAGSPTKEGLASLFGDAYVNFIRILEEHIPLLPLEFPLTKK